MKTVRTSITEGTSKRRRWVPCVAASPVSRLRPVISTAFPAVPGSSGRTCSASRAAGRARAGPCAGRPPLDRASSLGGAVRRGSCPGRRPPGSPRRRAARRSTVRSPRPVGWAGSGSGRGSPGSVPAEPPRSARDSAGRPSPRLRARERRPAVGVREDVDLTANYVRRRDLTVRVAPP